MSGAIMNKVWDLFKMPAEDKDDEDAVDYDEVLDKDEKKMKRVEKKEDSLEKETIK